MKQAVFVLLILTVSGFTQSSPTAIAPNQIACPTNVAAQVLLFAGNTLPNPTILHAQCVQLDPAGFKLDTTTNPPTLRALAAAPTPPVMPIFVDDEIPSGTINGVNAVFTLANTPVAASVKVVENGLVLQNCAVFPGACDYLVSGSTITFGANSIPQGPSASFTGDSIWVSYRH